jgi:release factor glutamine methyltransferase
MDTQDSFASFIARRQAGEPLQYITGEAEFFGLPFSVAPGVLIPRPETEHLIEEVIRLAGTFTEPSIADIGTGSGAIAVALAHSLSNARITAVDFSALALAIARQNAVLNHVENRIEFVEGDLLAPLAGKSFHVIASNPPYVPLTDRDSLSVEVREHEPHAALFAGDDGLAIYRRLIPEARASLVPGGWLVMEIGYGQQPAIEQLMLANKYNEVHFVADYQGIPRVAVGKKQILCGNNR